MYYNIPHSFCFKFRITFVFFQKRDDSGCVAVFCAFDTKTKKLTIGNIGDSRLLIVSHDGKVLLSTTDHKPDDKEEKARIVKAGYDVLQCTALVGGQRMKIWRVDGQYAYRTFLHLAPIRFR
jgi:protein phosphatase 1G